MSVPGTEQYIEGESIIMFPRNLVKKYMRPLNEAGDLYENS